MAEDGYLPSGLTRLHPRYGTPWIAIIASAVIYSLLAVHTLAQLITVYIWLRVTTSVMTVLAGWKLRQARPEMLRVFRIPWGRFGLIYVISAPLVLGYVVLRYSDPFAKRWGPVALLLGPVVYLLLRFARKRA